jgi:predicted secreted protein
MKPVHRIWLPACLWLALAAHAGEVPRYNQVSLDAQVTEQVGNDTMHVTLNAYGDHRDAAQLAAQINRDMEWALELVRQHADVRAGTGGYQTWPLTSRDNTSTRGWRGQQSLTLESPDSGLLGRLVGQLQERLKISAMNFTVSDGKRAEVENRLIDSALEAFKSRADIVSRNLKASGYRIVNLTLGTSAQQPPVIYRQRMATLAAEAADAPVAVEGGESEVRVSVSGTVELLIP